MGDTPYTLRHLAVNQVRQMTIGGIKTQKQIEATRDIRLLVDANPNTVLLFAHDHTDYQFDIIERIFKDGMLTQNELNDVKKFRKKVFEKGWRLEPGNMPFYIPPSRMEETGSVGFK